MNSYTFKDVQKLVKIKSKAKSKGELKEVASCCNVLGELFQQQGKFQDAINEHEEERVICQELDDTLGIGIAHRKIGEALNELGNYESALKHHQKYLVLTKSVKNLLEVQRALATIGRTHFCHAEALTTNNKILYDSALSSSKQSYLKSLECCERLKNSVSERDYMQMNCRLLLNLGLVCDLQSQDSAAINYYKQSIYVADKYNFREDLHRCRYSLAVFYQKRKNYSQAKREVELAEKVAFQLKEKSLICDDLSLKAQLFVIMADFESARRYLLKAYRQKTPVAVDRERIETDLRSAIRLCKLQDMCCSLSPNDIEKLIKLYEQMGDACASMKAYSRAIDFYLKMQKEANELGWSEKDLNPIFVSLSQTYMDVKDYKSAITYYKKELEQYSDNPSEASRTVLNIANAMEENGASYYELEPLYSEAVSLAEKASNPRLKATALNSLAVLQETNGYSEKSREAMAVVEEICQENDIDLDDESELSCSQTIRNDLLIDDDNIPLEDLIDEDSDEEEQISTSCNKRRPKRSIEKLNVKGETALHRACIKQDISLVRMLLQQKHKINVRDNCGWTPLHEACNYGNVEIVNLLLEHGASVSDRGGKHCEGVTPLHDAASCGHIDVMETLLKHGANPLAMTDHGESVYECLVKWRLRTGGNLDSLILQSCLKVEQRLKESMKTANIKVPSMKEIEHKQCNSSSLIPEEDEPNELVSHSAAFDSDEAECFPISEPTADRSASTSAQREYATAMRAIRSSAVHKSTASPASAKRNRIPALVLQDQVDDEWLEEDMLPTSRKLTKKSSSKSSDFEPHYQELDNTKKKESRLSISRLKTPPTSRLRCISLSSDDDDFTVEEIPPSAKRSKLSPAQDLTDESSSDRPNSPILSGPKRTKRPIQLSISKFVETPNVASDNWSAKKSVPSQPYPQPAQQPPSVLKLNVRIQDKVLLIPVECNKSVKWLSEEAARRYYNMTGLNPILSLQTLDGAVLNGEDTVSIILQDGDKVIGEMIKWDLQPLPERYANLCRQLETVRLGDVDSLLSGAHVSGKLSLELPLGTFLTPVVKALRYQENLWDLNLSATKMNDLIFNNLCEALSTLPHLIHLDLRSNFITASGLTSLSETLQANAAESNNSFGLKKLETLKLSHNPLGDGAAHPLAVCLRHLVCLHTLEMESCCLTDHFIEGHQLVSSLKRTAIVEVSIGCNDWSAQAVKTWLQLLDLRSLKRLSLVDAHCDGVVAALTSSIRLVQDCPLHHLDLSHCNLNDDNFERLVSSLGQLTHLKKLIFRNNPKLHVDVVAGLLTRCQGYAIRIEELDFSGCCFTHWSADVSDVRCVEALRSFLSWSRSLHRLALSFSRRQNDSSFISSLTDVWQEMFRSNAVISQITPHQLLLTVSSL